MARNITKHKLETILEIQIMTVTGSRMTTNRHRSQYGDKEDDFGDNLDCRVRVDVWMGKKRANLFVTRLLVCFPDCTCCVSVCGQRLSAESQTALSTD